jgi:hypothetical protein
LIIEERKWSIFVDALLFISISFSLQKHQGTTG